MAVYPQEPAWLRVGLLLVPVGGLWLWLCRRSGKSIRPPLWLARVTLGTCILIALVLVLVAFGFGLLLAAGTGAMAGLLIVRVALIRSAPICGLQPTRQTAANLTSRIQLR